MSLAHDIKARGVASPANIGKKAPMFEGASGRGGDAAIWRDLAAAL
jgi:hypothetical protein